MTRPPAPPYRDEGPHALWHVSDAPDLERFEPRAAADRESGEALVWAVDTRHLPLYWFPRDCPRATFWAKPETSDEDVERFLSGDRALRVHAMESVWLARFREVAVYAYRVPEATFAPHAVVGGYWLSREAVASLERVSLGDLLERHARAGIELRIVSDLVPLWDRVIHSTLEFSGMRLRNSPGARAAFF